MGVVAMKEIVAVVGAMAKAGAPPYDQYQQLAKMGVTLTDVYANWGNQDTPHPATPGVRDTVIFTVRPSQVG